MGLRSNPSGSFVPETPSTSFSFSRSDRFTPPRRPDPLVLANLLWHWQDLRFLTSGIPVRTFQAEFTIFTDASTQGWGAHMGYSQILGTWTRTGRKLHISCLEFKAVVSALQHWAPLLQGHQVMIATDNSTVVSYINKQGGTRSPTLLRLTVELLIWLEAQNIIVRARHIPCCLNVIADHLSCPNQPIPTEWSLHPEIVSRIFGFWGTTVVDMFVTASNSHLPWFMSPIPEPRALAVDALSQDWQGRSMYMFPPFPLLNKVIQKVRSTQAAEVILIAPWWPKQSWIPHLLRLCVDHPLFFPYRRDIGSRSSVSAGSEVCLRRKVVPSARMEALMRHYKAAGFSDEISRLAAAPRRPSTNRMYDDRWLRFARWAAGQGFDRLDPTAAQIASFLFTLFDTDGLSPQTVNGYRTCLGSVLNRTGKAKVVLHKTISDMIASMELQRELQRPRITPVLPQWDLGIVLEALSKPPYEPSREASFKHLTLKTVFLLAMASAGRRSELQALRFDQNYIEFKPKGAGVTLYFSPEFMRKNQKPSQVNGPWYIPAVPTGRSEFGAPNYPVRALRYYHRYITEHPELRKDRRRLFVPIKDNNAGKELSASTISRWICTAIVDSHAAVQNSRNFLDLLKLTK